MHPASKYRPYPASFLQAHAYPFGSALPGRNWSDAGRIYRYGFNGKEKDAETATDNCDFGARIYDGRLGRWLSVDPHKAIYNSISPYAFCLNIPTSIIDSKGLDPINPRTGKPFYISLYYHAVISFNLTGAKNRNSDEVLLARINRFSSLPMRGNNEPDGIATGEKGFPPERSFSETSLQALEVLNSLIECGSNQASTVPPGSWGAPNDYAWNQAASSGSYTFLDEYSETSIGHFDKAYYSVYTVKENYITQIITLKRGDDGKYNIKTVRNFNIVKGEIQERKIEHSFLFIKWVTIQKYRTLKVTETVQDYNDNKPSSNKTTFMYTKEEIIE